MDLEHLAEEFPDGSGGSTLQIAAWRLQPLLTAIGNSDGKVMFLTALSAAGMSALVGIAAASSPASWPLGFGFAFSGLSVVIGLGRLWAADVQQFPNPDEAWNSASEVGENSDLLQWQHFSTVREAVAQADDSLRRSTLIMRILLIETPVSLALVVAAALVEIS
jgi:hypothetical protein